MGIDISELDGLDFGNPDHAQKIANIFSNFIEENKASENKLAGTLKERDKSANDYLDWLAVFLNELFIETVKPLDFSDGINTHIINILQGILDAAEECAFVPGGLYKFHNDENYLKKYILNLGLQVRKQRIANLKLAGNRLRELSLHAAVHEGVKGLRFELKRQKSDTLFLGHEWDYAKDYYIDFLNDLIESFNPVATLVNGKGKQKIMTARTICLIRYYLHRYENKPELNEENMHLFIKHKLEWDSLEKFINIISRQSTRTAGDTSNRSKGERKVGFELCIAFFKDKGYNKALEQAEKEFKVFLSNNYPV